MAIVEYIKTIWQNDQAPAINAANLGNIEDGIGTVTDEAIRLDSVTLDLSSPASISFVPQDPIPSAVEALLFYDDTRKDFAYYDDTGELHYITQSQALTSISGGSAGTSITTTWTDITNYTDTISIIMTADQTTGEILAPIDGIYSASINFVATFDDVGSSPEFVYIRVVGDQGFISDSIPFSVARNSEGASMYPKTVSTLVGGENYKLQVSASTTITGVTYSYVSFELEAERLTP